MIIMNQKYINRGIMNYRPGKKSYHLFSDAGWSPQTNCVSKICAQAICDKTNCGQNVAIILAGKFMLVGWENMSTKSCGKPFLVQNLDVALDPCLVLRQPFNNLETHLWVAPISVQRNRLDIVRWQFKPLFPGWKDCEELLIEGKNSSLSVGKKWWQNLNQINYVSLYI